MKQLGIYKIRNVTNQKFYVGSSNDMKDRFRKHRILLRKNKHHCRNLQAAWNKYGEECFKFEVIEALAEEALLFEAENKWLLEWVGKPECYNAGRSAEAPMRGMPKELTPNWGKVVSPEMRAQISTSLKATYAATPGSHPRLGKTHTAETKAKISVKKLANPSRYWEGKERSPETRAKISAAQAGKKRPPQTYTPAGLLAAQENMRRNGVRMEKSPLEAVIAKFPAEVRARYDFSKAVYTGALSRITGCVCPLHGEFDNYAARFRKGWGCAACGNAARAVSKSEEMKQAWASPQERAKMLAARQKP